MPILALALAACDSGPSDSGPWSEWDEGVLTEELRIDGQLTGVARHPDGTWLMSAKGGVSVELPSSFRGDADTAAVAQRVLTVGGPGGDPDLIFSRIVGIAAAGDGRFAVLDRGMSRVRVFGDDGRLRFARGHAGAGPGGFSSDVASVAFDENGFLYVLDPGRARITAFDRDGELTGTVRLARAEDERVLEWRQVRPGTVLEGVRTFADRGYVVRRRILPTEGVTTVLELDFEEPSDGRDPEDPIELLGLRPLWVPLPDGGVAWAYSGPGTSATVYARSRAGAIDSITVRGFSPRAMSRAERVRLERAAELAWAEAMGREPEDIRFISERFALPDTLPALTGLHPGPSGSLLIQGFEGTEELDGLGLFTYFALALGGDTWRLLDREGEVEGWVAGFADGFQPMAVAGDTVYGVARDPLGVESVAVYRLAATTSKPTARGAEPEAGKIVSPPEAGRIAGDFGPNTGRRGPWPGRLRYHMIPGAGTRFQGERSACQQSGESRGRTDCSSTVSIVESPNTCTLSEMTPRASSGSNLSDLRATTAFHPASSTRSAPSFESTTRRFTMPGTSTAADTDAVIQSVEVTDEEIIARLSDGRTIAVPLVWSWRLCDADPRQRQNFRIIGGGQGVHWPEVDEDISLQGMLHGTPAPRPA